MARILVAEDDRPLADSVQRALARAGHEVVSVPDGLMALAALGSGRFDLLLADIAMPELDGIALALKVDKDFPQTRILMMTGFKPEGRHAHNLGALVHGVIEKPFTLSEICHSVEQTLMNGGSQA